MQYVLAENGEIPGRKPGDWFHRRGDAHLHATAACRAAIVAFLFAKEASAAAIACWILRSNSESPIATANSRASSLMSRTTRLRVLALGLPSDGEPTSDCGRIAVKSCIEDREGKSTEPLMHESTEVADDLLVLCRRWGGNVLSMLGGNAREAAFSGLVLSDDVADGVPDGALESQKERTRLGLVVTAEELAEEQLRYDLVDRLAPCPVLAVTRTPYGSRDVPEPAKAPHFFQGSKSSGVFHLRDELLQLGIENRVVLPRIERDVGLGERCSEASTIARRCS